VQLTTALSEVPFSVTLSMLGVRAEGAGDGGRVGLVAGAGVDVRGAATLKVMLAVAVCPSSLVAVIV
jgi:hypothetical protein